jgi:tetratricopeptide (TPR) repeat protein
MSKARHFQRLHRKAIERYDSQVSEAKAELARLRSNQTRKRAKILGRLGMLLLADETTQEVGFTCIAAACDDASGIRHHRLIATNAIRRATSLQYRGEHVLALTVFDEALEVISANRLRKLRDYALQHKGKCLVEMGEIELARKCFREALALRKKRKDVDLITSTTEALAAIKGGKR